MRLQRGQGGEVLHLQTVALGGSREVAAQPHDGPRTGALPLDATGGRLRAQRAAARGGGGGRGARTAEAAATTAPLLRAAWPLELRAV